MLPILASLLAKEGLSLLSSAIRGGSDKVKDLVEEKTGIKMSDETQLSDEDIQKLREFELSHKLELEKLSTEERNLRYTTAHATYRKKSSAADTIAKQVIYFNLPVIAILVLVNVSIVHYLQENATLIAIVSNVIGIAIGNLFNERNTIINFFFGSSEKEERNG